MLNINVPRLQFEVESIMAWINANHANQRSLADDGVLPLETLGHGNYGSAYRLVNFPGLVLKLCWKYDDGYPLYIRAVHNMGARKYDWMPDIYALGGSELDGGTFWCVLKEYTDRCEGLDYWQDTHPAWYRSGGYDIANAINTATGKVYADESAVPRHLRQFMEQYREFVRPLGRRVESYMHPGNVLWDGDRFVITDPWAGCADKREAHRIIEGISQCQSVPVTAASLLSAKNSARHQPRSPKDVPFWIAKRGLKHGELRCLSVSVPSTKSRVRSPGFSFNTDFASLELRASETFVPAFDWSTF